MFLKFLRISGSPHWGVLSLYFDIMLFYGSCLTSFHFTFFKVLEEWYDESSKKWSNNARVIAKSWIKATGEDKALQPRCITRDLKWGTPVPLKGYESKVS